MFRIILLLFIFISQLGVSKLAAAHPDQTGKVANLLHDWQRDKVLQPTARKPARTAVLIIAPPVMGNCFVENRWKIGTKVWEQYMNSHPNVDCYFLKCANTDPERSSSDQVWLDGNTIYVGGWYEKDKRDRLLHKTILAIEWLLPKYTHFIRTNLNVFLNLKNVNEYMETHSQSFYTTPIWEGAWYAIGYSIMFTADVAAHIVSEYRRLEDMQEELITPEHSDDGALTSLATGVWPYDKVHSFRCCPTLPFGIRQLMCQDSFSTEHLSQHGILLKPPISLTDALHYCGRASDTVMLYRTGGGLTLNELAQYYEYLMRKTYPKLSCIDLMEYVKFIELAD